jgi:hypothetical protein
VYEKGKDIYQKGKDVTEGVGRVLSGDEGKTGERQEKPAKGK